MPNSMICVGETMQNPLFSDRSDSTECVEIPNIINNLHQLENTLSLRL